MLIDPSFSVVSAVAPQAADVPAPLQPHCAGQTYVVTGGAGFIGAHVVGALLARDARVLVVDDFNDFYDPALKEANLATFLSHPHFRLYRQDIRDARGLEAVFTDAFGGPGQTPPPAAIVHLAARAGVRPSLTQPRLYLETNVTGTLNLAELARVYRVPRFVFASSSSVYGDAPGQVPFVEAQDISKPISPYAATKAMGEQLLHTYSHLYGIQVVALRFFTVYGAAQRPDLAIHKFTRLIFDGQPIPMFGDGSTRRDYTYIEDILQGVLAALAYDTAPFDVFNLGESQTTALATLIAMIENALDKSAIIQRQPAQPGDVSITYANIDKARRLLGYQPSTPLTAGLPRFVDWFLQRQATLSGKCIFPVGL
jgi:UDP-glucuronate 4-epimerase